MNRQPFPSVWSLIAAALLLAGLYPLLRTFQARPSAPMRLGAGESSLVPGEIVVELAGSAGPDAISRLAMRYSLSYTGADRAEASRSRIAAFTTAPAMVGAVLARLRADPEVAAAEPQHLFRAFWKPNDPRFHEQWNFERIHMEKAWEITRGKGAVVAVIDTGVAFEADAKCYHARDFKQTKFTEPYDFVAKDRHPNDDNGHGTHVAGTIAESTDNGEGVAGIAFEASVMPLKVLTADGWGRMSDVAAAIRYAADHGARVINMSLGGPRGDSITHNACKYALSKGALIVCAAGNTGSEGVGYPAAYPECAAVSALGPTGELAPYSSWGTQIAVSAPGGDKTRGEDKGILQNSVLRTGTSDSGAGSHPSTGAAEPDRVSGLDDYFYFQGTSMATPHVAGVAALVASQGIKDPAEVRAILLKSAHKRGPREKYGAGELDAAAAVRLARSENGLYYGQLALIGGVWLWCGVVGLGRRGRAPAAAALAVTIGLVLPDLITSMAGFDSAWNLVGHSVLLPGYLLVSEAETQKERRFLALLAAATTAHLALDLAAGTAPVIGSQPFAALPWLWANVAVGAGAFVSGLRR